MPLDLQALRLEIRKMYSQVADDPKKEYHFHTGPTYAVERPGYRPEDLAELRARVHQGVPAPPGGPARTAGDRSADGRGGRQARG